MAEEEVIDAEASTLNKQVTALDHLRHLLNIGWKPVDPIIQTFVEKHGLEDDLREISLEYKDQ